MKNQQSYFVFVSNIYLWFCIYYEWRWFEFYSHDYFRKADCFGFLKMLSYIALLSVCLD